MFVTSVVTGAVLLPEEARDSLFNAASRGFATLQCRQKGCRNVSTEVLALRSAIAEQLRRRGGVTVANHAAGSTCSVTVPKTASGPVTLEHRTRVGTSAIKRVLYHIGMDPMRACWARSSVETVAEVLICDSRAESLSPCWKRILENPPTDNDDDLRLFVSPTARGYPIPEKVAVSLAAELGCTEAALSKVTFDPCDSNLRIDDPPPPAAHSLRSLPAAVCLAGQYRSFTHAASLYHRHFVGIREYVSFLSIEPNVMVPTRIMQQLQLAEERIARLHCNTTSQGFICPKGINRLAGFNHVWLYCQAARVAACAPMIVAHEQTHGVRFSFVVRLRPDLRFAAPMPHVKMLYRQATGGRPETSIATWDDQIAIAPRNLALVWMKAMPLAFGTCASAFLWSEACDVSLLAAKTSVEKGVTPCPPIKLSWTLAGFVEGVNCGFPWDRGCGLIGVDLPPKWRFYDRMLFNSTRAMPTPTGCDEPILPSRGMTCRGCLFGHPTMGEGSCTRCTRKGFDCHTCGSCGDQAVHVGLTAFELENMYKV